MGMANVGETGDSNCMNVRELVKERDSVVSRREANVWHCREECVMCVRVCVGGLGVVGGGGGLGGGGWGGGGGGAHPQSATTPSR
jgi:hypothetical protein